jgi:hypothetical protein
MILKNEPMKNVFATVLVVLTFTVFLLTACADQHKEANDVRDMQDAQLNESPAAPQDGTLVENDTIQSASVPDQGSDD